MLNSELLDGMAMMIDSEKLKEIVEYQCDTDGSSEALKWCNWFKEVINAECNNQQKDDLGVEKIIDELEKEFEKVNIPIMDKLTLFAKVQNALYRCTE